MDWYFDDEDDDNEIMICGKDTDKNDIKEQKNSGEKSNQKSRISISRIPVLIEMKELKNIKDHIYDDVDPKLGTVCYVERNGKEHSALQTRSGRIYHENIFYDSVIEWLENRFDKNLSERF